MYIEMNSYEQVTTKRAPYLQEIIYQEGVGYPTYTIARYGDVMLMKTETEYEILHWHNIRVYTHKKQILTHYRPRSRVEIP